MSRESWDHLASLSKLCNLSSYKVLHLWLDHNYPWAGHLQQKTRLAYEVCLPCSPRLLTLLLIAIQLLGALEPLLNLIEAGSVSTHLAVTPWPLDPPHLKPAPPTWIGTLSVNSLLPLFYQGLDNGSSHLGPALSKKNVWIINCSPLDLVNSWKC